MTIGNGEMEIPETVKERRPKTSHVPSGEGQRDTRVREPMDGAPKMRAKINCRPTFKINYPITMSNRPIVNN